MNVPCCLKIPLISMRAGRFASCENIVSRFQTSSILPPPPRLVPKSPWRNSFTASAEEFYCSFYFNEGLENKLARAPLLDLANILH